MEPLRAHEYSGLACFIHREDAVALSCELP